MIAIARFFSNSLIALLVIVLSGCGGSTTPPPSTNNTPVGVTDSINVDEGALVSVLDGGNTSVLSNDTDADNDNLNAILVSPPSNIANDSDFQLQSDGSFSYQHDGSESTSDSFTYRANDGSANSNLVTVNISINPINDAPATLADTNIVNEDDTTNTVMGNVISNDTDPDNTLVVQNATNLNNTGTYGTLSISADGAYTYTLDNTNVDVNNLDDGQELQETYDYVAVEQVVTGTPLSSPNKLTITIRGKTDIALNIHGVWEINTTVIGTASTPTAPANPVGPECGPIGDTDKTFVSFAQNGAVLSAYTESGFELLNGTFNENSGVFTLPKTTKSSQLAELLTPVNTAALETYNSSIELISATMTSPTTMVGVVRNTNTKTSSANVITDRCDYYESFTGTFVYRHQGTEAYTGVYGLESIFQEEGIANGDNAKYSSPLVRGTEVLTIDVNPAVADPINIRFLPLEGVTDIITSTFDPSTGYFTVEVNTEDIPPASSNTATEVFRITGIFLRDPATNPGANGSPLMVAQSTSIRYDYIGQPSSGTVTSARNEFIRLYAKLLNNAPYTRTIKRQKSNGADATEVTIGIPNPPTRVSSPSSRLYLQVDNGNDVNLCQIPFQDDGVTIGRYFEQKTTPLVSTPSQYFDFLFPNSQYSRITCNIGDDTVITDNTPVKIRIMDTGTDGLLDGVNDTIAWPLVGTEVNYNARVVTSTDQYANTIALNSIVVNGGSITTVPTGRIVPFTGFIDPSENLNLSWPTLNPSTGVTTRYQVRLESPNSDIRVELRMRTNNTSQILTPELLPRTSIIRLVAQNNLTPDLRSLSMNRFLEFSPGIRGDYAVALTLPGGGAVPAPYASFILTLSMAADGSVICASSIAELTCATGSIDYANNTVILNMTDTAAGPSGLITDIGAPDFTMTLDFSTSSTAATVTSTPAIGTANVQ